MMIRKGLAVGIIFLFVGITIAPSINQSIVTAFNSIKIQNSEIIDYVNIWCEGPGILNSLARGPVFKVIYNHTYEVEELTTYMWINVTNKKGEILFYTYEPLIDYNIPTNYSCIIFCWTFRNFWQKHHYLLGPFDINIRLWIQNDGSEKSITFNGFIFIISAIVMDENTK
jgi:hypothetical protein